jgi:hypothetical protein
MQTLLVHNRRPLETLGDMGWTGFLAFEIYVGSMIMSALLHTVFGIALLGSIVTGTLGFPDSGWGWANFAILVAGYGGAFAIVIAGLRRLGMPRRVLLAQALLPLYWVLHTVAAARASYELFARPYYWAKTAHGRTRQARSVGASRRRDPPASPGDRIEPVLTAEPVGE